MQQQIQFVTAPDGVSLAVATMGSGLPLLIVPGWISHLEMDWTWPQSHDVFERLARDHLLVRYDKRGTGLSDRDVSDYSLEAQVAALDAIISGLGLRGAQGPQGRSRHQHVPHPVGSAHPDPTGTGR